MKKTHIKLLDGYISIDKACEIAGITRMTFYNWFKNDIPVTLVKQLNKRRLVNEVEWNLYLESLRIEFENEYTAKELNN